VATATTYYKRYRMEIGLDRLPAAGEALACYRFRPWSPKLLESHAQAKHLSFRDEMDSIVFSCLAHREGCRTLMERISARSNFVPEATWLVEHRNEDDRVTPCGTVQGLVDAQGLGSIQNFAVTPPHRGRGVGTQLLYCGLDGFRRAGLRRASLEVTAENMPAVRLYQRLGFTIVKTLYRMIQVPYSDALIMGQE